MMTFEECFIECLANNELVEQFDRLKGTNLSLQGTYLDLQIDISCNRMEGDLKQFAEFVKECVYDRIPF